LSAGASKRSFYELARRLDRAAGGLTRAECLTLVPRLAVGVLWVVLGVGKAGSLDGLAAYLDRLDIGISSSVARYVAGGIAMTEVSLGLLLLMYPIPRSLSGIVPRAALVGALLVAAATFALPSDAADCGCFGGLAQATQGRKAIVAGSILLLTALAGVGPSRTQPARLKKYHEG